MEAADLDYAVDLPDAILGWSDPDPPPRYADWADVRPKTIGTTRGAGPDPSVDDTTLQRLNDGPDRVVTIGLLYDPATGLIRDLQMPVRDEATGGLEGRFGTWVPADVDSGPMADYRPDTRDALTNGPLGRSGPYQIDGQTVGATSMARSAWPTDMALSAAQVRDWMAARGDAFAARVFDRLVDEGL